jgi:hypothetical protein
MTPKRMETLGKVVAVGASIGLLVAFVMAMWPH